MKLTRLIILFLLCTTAIFSQWYTQPSGTTHALKSVDFINESTGFICGEYIILKTTNGGSDWISVNVPHRNNDILFINTNTGFICSDSGKISRTTDNGNSWSLVNSGTSKNLMRIDFLNSTTGIIAGFGGTVLKTTNTGISWQSILNIDTLNFYGCKIINENKYIVTGTSSAIYRSTNAGLNWLPGTMGVVNPMWAPEFIDENTGWATGCCGMFIKTTNFGDDWSTETYLTLGFTLYTMKFINSTTGYVCGDNGTIYRTTNQGSTWDSTSSNTGQIIYNLQMLNLSTGWAVGGFGTILKTTNGGGQGYTIGINQVSNEIPREFNLYQNYPNPFNPETKIIFDVLKKGNVKLAVYDITGRELEVLVNDKLSAGTFEISFNAVKYATGIYFYKIETPEGSISRKMALVK